MGNVVKVLLDSLFKAVIGLTHMQFAIMLAENAIDNSVAVAGHVGLGIVFTTGGL